MTANHSTKMLKKTVLEESIAFLAEEELAIPLRYVLKVLAISCWAENEIFLRLKAERKIVVLCFSVARLAKLCLPNKSLLIFD